MTMARPGVVLVLAAVAVTMSCGGGDGGSIPLDDLGDALTETLCNRAVRCGEFPSKASCVSAYSIRPEQTIADVASGKTAYDGKAAAKCLDTFGSVHGQGSCLISEQFAATGLVQSCRDTFTGRAATGAPCFVNEECVSLTCDTTGCAAPGMCCAGACVPEPPRSVPLGGDCSAPGAECVQRTRCKVTATGATCVMHTGLGQPCTVLTECIPGLLCGVDPAAPGTCAPVPKEGQACKTVAFGCDASNTFCDPTTMKCVRRVAVGASCAAGAACVLYARCDVPTQTCVALGSPGQACADDEECLGLLDCVAGACAAPPPTPVCQ